MLASQLYTERLREALLVNIQKRHVIGHNLGIVDAKFAEHARDAKIGENVTLLADDIRLFARLSQLIVDQLDAWLAGSRLSPHAGERESMPAVKVAGQAIEQASDGLQLSKAARDLGHWFASASTSGRPGSVNLEAMPDDLRNLPRADLDEALAELEADGLIKVMKFLGGEMPRVSATLELFAAFDPAVFGAVPAADAGTLASVVLGMDASVSSKDLREKVNWPLRRFNPALAIMVERIGQGRVSRAYDNEYATPHFHVNADDRVALKRFMRQLGFSN